MTKEKVPQEVPEKKEHIRVLESMLSMMFASIQKDIDDMFMKLLEKK